MDFFADNISIVDLNSAIKLFNESRAGFLKLFNNSPVCMSMTSPNLEKRTYVRVNKQFIEKFGFDESEILGRTSVEIGILDAQESERVAEIIRTKGRLQNDYVKCTAKNGAIVHTVSSIEMMELNDQKLLVSFFIDITQIIAQQVVIETHAKQLEEANKALESFSYSVSHDLRAPLRAIEGFTKILEEDFNGALNEQGRKMLAAVQRNSQKMSHLIDDLLAFSRLGKHDLQRKKIDMNALLREVLDDFAQTSKHRAKIIIGETMPIWGDQALLKQVLTNLISNGIKYSSKKESPEVEISSKIENDHVTYTVSDNGEGFDMKYSDKLFGVFQRLHSERQFEGTGVGLAIVKRIIEKHGGQIHAEAAPGKGARFSFALPLEGSQG
jgi:PAS domain S-box-containing protein